MGLLAAKQNPIATVIMRARNQTPIERHALVIGVVGTTRISTGLATARIAPGTKIRLAVRLYPGVLSDVDDDGAPDIIDRCPDTTTLDGGARPSDGAAPIDRGADNVLPSIDAVIAPPRDSGAERAVVDAPSGAAVDAPPDAAPPDAPAADAPPDAPPDVAPDAPVNMPPIANAGPDQVVTEPRGEASLLGSAQDDGRPVPPGRLTVSWSKVTGLGDVTFNPPTTAATRARFSRPGTYVLRLTASDGEASAQDLVSVTVLDLDSDLAGWWRFDDPPGDTAQDSSGNGNHARLFDGATIVRGRVGTGALDLNRIGDLARVESPANGRLDFAGGDFTIALWMATTQLRAQPLPGTAIPQLLAKVEERSGVRAGYEIRLDFDGLGFLVWLGRTTPIPPVALATNDGQWHHVVGRKTSNEVAIYIDGRRREVFPAVPGTVSNRAPLLFGGGVFGGDFQGLLDDVRIYPRALADLEITVLAGVPAP